MSKMQNKNIFIILLLKQVRFVPVNDFDYCKYKKHDKQKLYENNTTRTGKSGHKNH